MHIKTNKVTIQWTHKHIGFIEERRALTWTPLINRFISLLSRAEGGTGLP
ncbi:hypothetical protein LEMLEM_LOCUS8311, partial [Lemmus lemmus]